MPAADETASREAGLALDGAAVSDVSGTSDQVQFAAPDVGDLEVEAVIRVLRSGWLTTGAECERLEEELAVYLDVAHVVAMSSCTAALETAYAHLNLPSGAKV